MIAGLTGQRRRQPVRGDERLKPSRIPIPVEHTCDHRRPVGADPHELSALAFIRPRESNPATTAPSCLWSGWRAETATACSRDMNPELDFFVSSLKRANYSERLIRRRRISGTNLSRVPRLEDNGVWHFFTLLSVDHLCGLRQELGQGRSFFESSDRNLGAPVKTQTFGRSATICLGRLRPHASRNFSLISRDVFLSESSPLSAVRQMVDNREPPERFPRVGELSGMAKARGAPFCRAAPRST